MTERDTSTLALLVSTLPLELIKDVRIRSERTHIVTLTLGLVSFALLAGITIGWLYQSHRG